MLGNFTFEQSLCWTESKDPLGPGLSRAVVTRLQGDECRVEDVKHI